MSCLMALGDRRLHIVLLIHKRPNSAKLIFYHFIIFTIDTLSM
jgi:hypothetical protein